MTEDEKQKVIESGILDKFTKADEYIELFTILKNNGVDITKISNKSNTKLREIKQKGIDINKIIEDNDLDGEISTGSIKSDIRTTIKGEQILVKMTDKQKQRFIELGIMEERETKAQECLRLFSKLKENGIDLSKIKHKDTLKDIQQTGVNIQEIIEDNNLDEEIKVGDLKYRIKLGIEGKEQGIDMTEKEREEFINLGIMEERKIKTKGQQYLELFKTLRKSGVKTEEITTTTATIRDIKQEGIDIEKIIEENHLDGDIKIGSIVMRIREGIRGSNSKNKIKLTEEEKKEFIELGINHPTKLEILEETKRKLQEERQKVDDKKIESAELKKKYELELEKKEGKSL